MYVDVYHNQRYQGGHWSAYCIPCERSTPVSDCPQIAMPPKRTVTVMPPKRTVTVWLLDTAWMTKAPKHTQLPPKFDLQGRLTGAGILDGTTVHVRRIPTQQQGDNFSCGFLLCAILCGEMLRHVQSSAKGDFLLDPLKMPLTFHNFHGGFCSVSAVPRY